MLESLHGIMTHGSRFSSDPKNVASDLDSPRRDAVRRTESRPGGARYPAQRAGTWPGRPDGPGDRREPGRFLAGRDSTAARARTRSGPPRSSARSWACRPKRINEFRNLDQGLWQGLQIDEIKRRNTKSVPAVDRRPGHDLPAPGRDRRAGDGADQGRPSGPCSAATRTRRSAWSSASRWPGWSPVTSGASPASSSTSAGPAANSNGSRSRPSCSATASPDLRAEPIRAMSPSPLDLGVASPSLRRRPRTTPGPDGSRARRRIEEMRGQTMDQRKGRPETPGTGTSSRNGSRSASGCDATGARPPSSASRSSRTCSSAPSATTTSASRPGNGSSSSWIRIPSRSGTPTCTRSTPSASTTAGRIRSGSRPSRPDGAQGGGRRRPGVHPGHPDRLRRHGQQLHHGQHGLGRRREADPRRSRKRPASGCRW